MADLPRQSAGAAIELAIDHDAAANARPDRRVQQVSRAPRGAEAELAQGSRAGVVLNVGGDAQPFRDRRCQHQVAKTGDVRRKDDAPAGRVDQTCRRDAGGGRPLAGKRRHTGEQLYYFGDDAL